MVSVRAVLETTYTSATAKSMRVGNRNRARAVTVVEREERRLAVQETDPRIELVHRFFSGTGPTYDRMARYATFGLDNRWKQRIVDLLPPAPSRILDLACGTGISTLAIARRFPRCHVTGVELREEYLAIDGTWGGRGWSPGWTASQARGSRRHAARGGR